MDTIEKVNILEAFALDKALLLPYTPKEKRVNNRRARGKGYQYYVT